MGLEIFSWGFWGWGTATRQLVAATDVVEAQRRFRPPLFVDIRLHRSGRAPGFRGDAFERVVGRHRYRWMRSLGNANVRTGRRVRIACPLAVEQLLDIALERQDQGSRVIFFCACKSPWASSCHRHVVGKLLAAAARRRQVHIEIREWPGGSPQRAVLSLRIAPAALKAIARGQKAIPLNRKRVPSELAGIPWGTLAMLKAGTEELPVAIGPATYRGGSWVLPKFQPKDEPIAEDLNGLRRQVATLRRELRLR